MTDANADARTRAERLAELLVDAIERCAADRSSPYVSDELGLDYVTIDGKFDLIKLAGMILGPIGVSK